MLPVFKPVQPRPASRQIILAGLGGAVAIAGLGALTSFAHLPMLIAPFGATCVLLFAMPAAPVSQPWNVVVGYVICALAGLIIAAILPDAFWSTALAVGLAISAMALGRAIHPPAGAVPLVVMANHPGPLFLVLPVLLGAIVLVAVAVLHHRLTGTKYPPTA